MFRYANLILIISEKGLDQQIQYWLRPRKYNDSKIVQTSFMSFHFHESFVFYACYMYNLCFLLQACCFSDVYETLLLEAHNIPQIPIAVFAEYSNHENSIWSDTHTNSHTVMGKWRNKSCHCCG